MEKEKSSLNGLNSLNVGWSLLYPFFKYHIFGKENTDIRDRLYSIGKFQYEDKNTL